MIDIESFTRTKTFTFSWTTWSGNGWSCKLQYLKNGSTWTDISGTNYNCDTTISNQSVSLPADGWYSWNWDWVQIRIIRTSDSTVVGAFPQSLLCSATSWAPWSTPNIDEDCNWVWDNYTTPNQTSAWLPTTAWAAYSCPSWTYNWYTITWIASAQWQNYSDMKFYAWWTSCTGYMTTWWYWNLISSWYSASWMSDITGLMYTNNLMIWSNHALCKLEKLILYFPNLCLQLIIILNQEFARTSELCYYSYITLFYRAMKSYRETTWTIQIRIKPSYDRHQTEFFRSYVAIGLKTLKDVGKEINYEEMCDEILAIPENICAPEWVYYWEYWKMRFAKETTRNKRNIIFRQCIEDITRKWLMPEKDDITWLTGNFETRILQYSKNID